MLAADEELPIDEVDKLLSIDNFLRYWSVESLLGFWDGYTQNQNNYFVYDNPADGKFYFMPWGADSCFTGGGGPFAGFGNRVSAVVRAEAMLPNRLFHTDEIPERYRQTLLEVLEEAWNEADLLAEVDRIEKLTDGQLHPNQKSRGGGFGWGRGSVSRDEVRRFISSRRQQIIRELEDWPIEVPDKPRKPMYSVTVGTASGTLETFWSNYPEQEQPESTTDINFQLNGESVGIENLTVKAHPMQSFGFGRRWGGQQSPTAMITIQGKRETNRQRITLTLMVPRQALAQESSDAIPVTGSISAGYGWGMPAQILNGSLQFTETGTQDGDKILGKFELDVIEWKGGIMDQMRGRGRR